MQHVVVQNIHSIDGINPVNISKVFSVKFGTGTTEGILFIGLRVQIWVASADHQSGIQYFRTHR